MTPHADDTLAVYQIIATGLFFGPFMALLGGIIGMALMKLPQRKNRRVRIRQEGL